MHAASTNALSSGFECGAVLATEGRMQKAQRTTPLYMRTLQTAACSKRAYAWHAHLRFQVKIHSRTAHAVHCPYNTSAQHISSQR